MGQKVFAASIVCINIAAIKNRLIEQFFMELPSVKLILEIYFTFSLFLMYN